MSKGKVDALDFFTAQSSLPVLDVPFVTDASEGEFLRHLIAHRDYQAMVEAQIETLQTEANRINWLVSQAMRHRELMVRLPNQPAPTATGAPEASDEIH